MIGETSLSKPIGDKKMNYMKMLLDELYELCFKMMVNDVHLSSNEDDEDPSILIKRESYGEFSFTLQSVKEGKFEITVKDSKKYSI